MEDNATLYVRGVSKPMLAEMDALPDMSEAGEWITLGKHLLRTQSLSAIEEETKTKNPQIVVRFVKPGDADSEIQ